MERAPDSRFVWKFCALSNYERNNGYDKRTYETRGCHFIAAKGSEADSRTCADIWRLPRDSHTRIGFNHMGNAHFNHFFHGAMESKRAVFKTIFAVFLIFAAVGIRSIQFIRIPPFIFLPPFFPYVFFFQVTPG